MLQTLEKFIEYLDSWQNQRDLKIKDMKERMNIEINNELNKQKEIYKTERNQKKLLYDALQGPKPEFKFPKFKENRAATTAIKDKYDPEKTKINQTFLSDSTAKGLRLTCRYTIDLSKHLLNNCGFEYVLTRKLNQDCLEASYKSVCLNK